VVVDLLIASGSPCLKEAFYLNYIKIKLRRSNKKLKEYALGLRGTKKKRKVSKDLPPNDLVEVGTNLNDVAVA
jgi:hypothetical protein